MTARLAIVALSLATAACASTPEAWRRACATEAVAERLATVAPAGLVLSERHSLGAAPRDDAILDLLTVHHVAWVEVPVWPRAWEVLERQAERTGADNPYSEGPGLYAVVLGDLSEPACGAALYRRWLAPDGHTRLHRPSEAADRQGLPPGLEPCFRISRTADVPDLGEELWSFTGPIAWTAPFALDLEYQEDARAGPANFGSRMTTVVRNLRSGEIIWRDTRFSIRERNPVWFPGVSICGARTAPSIFGDDPRLVESGLMDPYLFQISRP